MTVQLSEALRTIDSNAETLRRDIERMVQQFERENGVHVTVRVDRWRERDEGGSSVYGEATAHIAWSRPER